VKLITGSGGEEKLKITGPYDQAYYQGSVCLSHGLHQINNLRPENEVLNAECLGSKKLGDLIFFAARKGFFNFCCVREFLFVTSFVGGTNFSRELPLRISLGYMC